MRILISGASGLLGLNLAIQASSGHAVTGVVHEHVLKGLPFPVLARDLGKPDAAAALFDEVQPEAVIHCAAMANIDECEAEPERAMRINADLPGWLAGEARRCGVRLIHLSTDAVFDGEKGDYREEDAPNPLGVYARTKLAGERKVLEANPEALVARVNFYGWSLSGKRSLAEQFYYHLAAGRPMQGFTDVYFCPLLVNQLAELLIDLAESRLAGLYHLFSPECMSKYKFGIAIARKFGLDETLIRPTPLTQSGLKAARSPNLRMCSEKINLALSRPLPGQAEGLKGFYQLWAEGYPQRLRDYGSGPASD
ncbi:MAG TPA: SDR family oxidoreductase [Anaerolineaceae bacterium]|nr:SDR family oxidoreductase [Anaerolineaceae bacterium]